MKNDDSLSGSNIQKKSGIMLFDSLNRFVDSPLALFDCAGSHCESPELSKANQSFHDLMKMNAGEWPGQNKQFISHASHVFPSVDWQGIFKHVPGPEKEVIHDFYLEALKRWYSFKVYAPDHGNLILSIKEVARSSFNFHGKDFDEKYHELTEAAREFIVICDLRGNVSYINQMVQKKLGYGITEIVGKNIKYFVSAQDVDNIFERLAKRMKGDKNKYLYEVEVFSSNGESRMIEVSSSPIISNGKISEVLIIGRDVTEKKNEEAAIRESEEHYRILVENSHIGIVIIDSNYSFTYLNQKACQIAGYHKDELINTDFRKLLDQKSYDLVIDRYNKRQRGKTVPEVYECNIKRKDGENRTIEMRSTAVRDSEGSVKTIAQIIDITEQKILFAALQESKNRFKDLANLLPETVFEFDEHGVFSFVNPNGLKKFQYGEQDLKQGTTVFQVVDPAEHEAMKEKFKMLAAQRKTGSGEYTAIKKNGDKFPVEVYSSPVIRDGEIKGFRGFCIDITQRKKSEEALKKQNDELALAKNRAEESDRLKSAFLANISHEIRTPLNGIIGFSELLNDENLTIKERLQYLNTIKDSSFRLKNIIDDIIDISKIEANQVNIRKSPFNLNALMDDIYQFFSGDKRIQENNLLVFENHKELDDEQASIYSDPDRLQQILVNLLSNAFKYTSNGYIKFGYNVRDCLLEFYVEDTGTGIPDYLHEAIFHRFRQGDLELTKKYSGTGLGLAISKGLTELLGGKIWLDNNYQDGAKFIFTIPYDQIDYFMHSEPITDADKKRYNWEGRSILIAEDDDCNYQLLEILLQQTNASIIRAKTGKEAVSIFSGDHDFSVVLMDIQLPELNGYEATRAILKINPRIPVIAQTAYAMSEDRSKAMEAGCTDYIAKPIRKNQFFNLLDKYLQ